MRICLGAEGVTTCNRRREHERRSPMAAANALRLVILIGLLEKSATETGRASEQRETFGNKSLENRLPLRGYEERFPPQGVPYQGSFPRTRGVPPGREFYRRNFEDRSETTKKSPGKDDKREEDYLWKANRDALVGKPSEKGLRRGENFDSYNMKFLNGGEEGLERTVGGSPFRHEDGYAPQRHPVLEGTDDYLSTNRQKKMKKQGANGSAFVPFPPARERKPNIILVLTDDQDVELGSLNFMPKTLRLLRDGGAEFRHAYVTTPMCCPSRSSLLTGMYVHNHNVFTNNENCSNVQWQQTHETRTFATYLSNAGYRTGYFGKYLNKYNGSYIPPGWREWGGLIMNSRYYNYSINLNGKKIKHGFDYHKDYYPDLIANDSIAFLRQSKQYFSRKPVMLVVSFPAPHGPEDSAPQYSKMFFNVTTHHTPAYDFAPNPDKQWILQVTNKMQDIHKQFTDVLMTKRLQTLQSVDSAVERIYQELKNIGELDNTYIVYTSDHGYHLGQFGLVKGKSFPFEFDVRVPFLVRGPGIEPGTVVDDIVLNIDLAPTFLDLAGVESPLHMDGRSIVRLLHHRPSKRRRLRWPDTFLIESSGRREIPDANPDARKRTKAKESRPTKGTETAGGVARGLFHRTEAKEATGILAPDSSETDSVDEVEEEENSEEDNASASFAYRGIPLPTSSDIQVDNKIPQIVPPIAHPVPKLARLAMECQSPDMQSPCRPGQKWHCVPEGDRWRKYRCKFQKKCTCFTPNGFVYTRLYNEEKGGVAGRDDRRLKFGGGFRRKRSSLGPWSEASEVVDYTTLLSLMSRSSKVMTRRRREATEEHLTDVLDDLEHELVEAEETENSMNATVTLGQEPNVSRCSVTSQGKVNCSSLVYNDFKVWKKSRDEIEAKIKSLKAELEALKEIRKHLREKRPDSVTSTPEPLKTTAAMISFSVTAGTENETFPENSTAEVTSEAYEEENGTLLKASTTQTFFTEESGATATTTTEESHFTYSTTGVEETPASKRLPNEHGPKQRNHLKTKNNEDGSANRIHGVTTVNRGRDRCICRPEGQDAITKKEEKELAKEARRKLKEERLRKKERKLKKKAKLEKECLSEKMNCFIHDNEHWRTPPLWTEGPFCFCMNANNNTYSCLRTINATHNFLYCEFTTGFKTFYNLRIDPFEQLNRISTLTPDEARFLSNQLADLKACRGSKECTTVSGRENYGYVSNHHHHHQHQHHQQQHQPYGARVKTEST